MNSLILTTAEIIYDNQAPVNTVFTDLPQNHSEIKPFYTRLHSLSSSQTTLPGFLYWEVLFITENNSER